MRIHQQEMHGVGTQVQDAQSHEPKLSVCVAGPQAGRRTA
jgi:hypothetical protein